MYRIVGFLLIILTIYYVAKFRNGGVDPLFEEKVIKEESLEAYKAPEYLKMDPPPELEGSSAEKFFSKIVLNILKTEKGRLVIEKILRPMNSPAEDLDFTISVNNDVALNNLFNINIIESGSGRKALCGHKAYVKYRIVNMKDMVLDSGEATMELGKSKIFKGFDNVIIGMKKGEKRKALIPERFAYADPNYKGKKPINDTKDYRIEVKLLDIIGPDIGDDVKIFDDKVSLKVPMMCGDRPTFNVKIEEIGGGLILDTSKTGRPITFRLGDQTFPLIFSHSLFNKDNKGSRFVFLSGKYLKGFSNPIFNNMDKANIGKDKYYMIEFRDISYGEH